MRTDLAVIGAGPAGLAAALAAARRGIRVTLIDAAPRPGGQYFRQPAPGLRTEHARVPRNGRRTWTRLRDALAASPVDVRTDHQVWCVERESDGLTVHALTGPEGREPAEVRAAAVLLATGGYETVLPFPGWTLPGVVTAGGAQAMLKGGFVTPGPTAVVAGTGPLLLPVATGLAAAGVRVAALVESTDPVRLPRHAGALAGKLPEAAGYAARLLRHRVPVLARHTVVRAHGEDRLTGVTVAALDAHGRVRPGTERLLPCDALAVGHGMLPHTDLAGSLGCRLDGTAVAVDAEQRTDVPGVWAAGGPRASAGRPSRWRRDTSPAVRSRPGCGAGRPTRAPGRPPPGPAPRGAPRPRPWTPCTPHPPTGPTASPTTRWSAAARRYRRAPSARPSPSAPATCERSDCSPAPAWAGARGVCARLPSRPSRGAPRPRTAAPSPARSPWASWRLSTTGLVPAPRKDPHDRSPPPLAGSPRRHRAAVARRPVRRLRPVRRTLRLARGQRLRRGRAERLPRRIPGAHPEERARPSSRPPSPPSEGSGSCPESPPTGPPRRAAGPSRPATPGAGR